MKVIVPQHYIDKIEESRLELFKLVDDWELDRFQLNQMVNVTSDMWRIAHRRFNEYHEPDTVEQKLATATKALEDITRHKGDSLDDDIDVIVDLRDIARDALKDIRKQS